MRNLNHTKTYEDEHVETFNMDVIIFIGIKRLTNIFQYRSQRKNVQFTDKM
jgi:hypothetical protein